MFVSAIIVAAGSSQRMGTGRSKQFELINGKTVIERTLTAFSNAELIDEIVVVCRKEDEQQMHDIVKTMSIIKPISFTYGADSRPGSVLNGINTASKDTEYFAVHDGARPLVSSQLIDNIIQKAFIHKCAAPGIAVTDTIKVVHDSFAASTPDRSVLKAIQTPQVFERNVYLDAVKKAKDSDMSKITDDCMLAENAGYSIFIADGEKTNIKITTPVDIKLAEAILNG